ncbi:tripartite tricarboxylate transporter substrate binding protein [Pigmentiphaga sp. NML080357]|uniref:Bug family tripartite tricarboxylate transporter substrate binding protein n=1 Tax=Pigmentiphaga sp. NML080357 TaxID=2008675 RepID=UPI001303965F|nr:tripartite tricarboxylate transporter substrate-binding protein [Pigmentiphaga sp. NML080357]
MNCGRFVRASAAAFAILSAPAWGQPANTVVWSGFPVGGLGDQVSRPLVEQLRSRYPGTIVLGSKPGAGGRIAAEFVKRAPPDGATLLQGPSSPIVLYPHTYGAKLTYAPLADFVPVAPLASYAISMTVGPAVPDHVKTLADFIDWVRRHPDKANYGVPAAGSAPHFVGATFDRVAGLGMRSVAYKGGAPLLTDLLGGQVPVAFNVISEVLPHLKTGRLRSLAVSSPQRWPAVPDVPSFAELGYGDIAMVEFLGWYAPARTPAELVRRLNAAVQEALQTPQMQEVFAKNGLVPLIESPEAFAARVREDTARWEPIVKATGFTPED